MLKSSFNRIKRLLPKVRRWLSFDLLIRHGPIAAFFLFVLFVLFITAKFEIVPKNHSVKRIPLQVFSGDEPHYLITLNSILNDMDLDEKNNYENIRFGGFDAGARFKGYRLSHHTYIINRDTNEHTLWQVVFDYTKMRPCAHEAPDHSCFEQKEPLTIDYDKAVEISAHPVAFPAIVALAIGLFVQHEDQVEPFAIFFVALYSWVAVILTYFLARRVGIQKRFAIFSVVILCFASPWLIYSRSFYSETLSGLLLVSALWAMVDHKILVAGTLVAVAMAIKPLFVVFGWGWLICLFLQRDYRGTIQLMVTLGIFGLFICLFNYWQVGTIFLTGAQEWQTINSFEGLHNELTDSSQGLLVFVPWAAFVLWILLHSFEIDWKRDVDFHQYVAMPTALYYLVLVAHADLCGYSYGCRYWIPLLPMFAVVIGKRLAVRQKKTSRIILWVSIAAGSVIAIPGMLYYRYVWSVPYDTATRYFWSFLKSCLV